MKRIFITGANRGLGLALVKIYLDRANRVIAGCRHPDKAADLIALAVAHPNQLSVVSIDVSDDTSIGAARVLTGRMVDGIDLLINNAAILRGDSVLTMLPEVMIESYRTNTVGPVLVARHFLDLVRQGTDPAIVNISSEAGSLARYENSTHICSYACTKSALNMATRCLARELTKERIPVVAVYPGWVRTDMGGANAALSARESAQGIVRNVVDRMTMEMSGEFVTWEGTTCPW